jgi:hypothetical protein
METKKFIEVFNKLTEKRKSDNKNVNKIKVQINYNTKEKRIKIKIQKEKERKKSITTIQTKYQTITIENIKMNIKKRQIIQFLETNEEYFLLFIFLPGVENENTKLLIKEIIYNYDELIKLKIVNHFINKK